MENKDCQRIKLAGAEGCNIIYYEDCKVTVGSWRNKCAA